MSTVAHAEHAHAAPADEFGSATAGKIGMWLFLLSDAMSFSGLLIGYGILRAGTHGWPQPSEHLGIGFTAVLTFLLICSSVTMVLAVGAAAERKRSQALFWLGMTALGGILFLLGQRHEYAELIERGFTLKGTTGEAAAQGVIPQFASTFYIITGFHGFHVFSGVVYLLATLGYTAATKPEDCNYNRIEICGLFWHFVDLVWILVFTLVYLL